MDIIYTACFDGYVKNFCWPSRKTFVQSWINSITSAQREFPDSKVVIYCYDHLAVGFFERLGLTGVELVRAEVDALFKPFWVVAKLNTYQLHKGPFLHLDHDVFLEKGFGVVFGGYDAEFIFQQQEGLSIYQHGRIAFDTKDRISYWDTHLSRYPNVGIFYCANNDWAQSLCKQVQAFILRNYTYCKEFPPLGMALCLEQQPIGVISNGSKCAYLLETKDELRNVVWFDRPSKLITHVMGSNKATQQAVDGIEARFSYDLDKFNVACWYLQSNDIGLL